MTPMSTLTTANLFRILTVAHLGYSWAQTSPCNSFPRHAGYLEVLEVCRIKAVGANGFRPLFYILLGSS